MVNGIVLTLRIGTSRLYKELGSNGKVLEYVKLQRQLQC